MKGNIFIQEFGMNLRSVITWSVATAVLLLVLISVLSSIAVDAQLLEETLAEFPEQLLVAFGMEDLNLSTVLGYFSFAFMFVQLCLAIQAAYYGFSLVSIEERELTADFLLAKPVGRSQILTSKLAAALSGLLITDIVVWVSSIVLIQLFRGDETYNAGALYLLLLSVIAFQLFFLGVGLVVSLLVRRVRSVTPYAMALAFGMYVLNAFGDMLGENTIENITPFKHFDPGYIIDNGSFNLPLVSISLVVIVISFAGSYLLYRRRDIPAPV